MTQTPTRAHADDPTITAGGVGTAAQRARVRLAMSHAARSAARAMDQLHESMGTSSLSLASPFERRFRDMHAAAAHVMIGRFTVEAAGRVTMGLDPQFPYF